MAWTFSKLNGISISYPVSVCHYAAATLTMIGPRVDDNICDTATGQIINYTAGAKNRDEFDPRNWQGKPRNPVPSTMCGFT